jgi:hypothetical protein
MCGMLLSLGDWLKEYEALAVWIEGVALVLIFGLDFWERRSQQADRKGQENERRLQHVETSAQMEIWRKQIHADSVREIWKALRNFVHFVVHSGKVAVGKQFSEDDPARTTSIHGFKVFQPYLDLCKNDIYGYSCLITRF